MTLLRSSSNCSMLPSPPPLDWEEPSFFSLASSCLGAGKSYESANRLQTPLNTGEVRLVSWCLTLSEERQKTLSKLLNREERSRAERFTKKRLSASFVSARTGLRVWLAHFLGCLPTDIEFEYGPKGKPKLKETYRATTNSKLEFNLAHSGELALLAISTDPVGVDIERHRTLRSADGMAKRWYSQAEQKRILRRSEADQLAEFFHIWSLKESILKLVGSGVGESLPSLETPFEASGGITAPPPNNQLNLAKCWAQPINVLKGYSAAVSTLTQPTEIDWLALRS